MKDYPPILANPDRVRQAVSARNTLRKGISMTVERLAVCLAAQPRILDFALSGGPTAYIRNHICC